MNRENVLKFTSWKRMSNLFICRSYSGIFTAVSELMIASITTCKLAGQGRLISKPTVKPTVPAAEAEALQRCLRLLPAGG